MADRDHSIGPKPPEVADAGDISAPGADFVTERRVPEGLRNEQPDSPEDNSAASDLVPKVQTNKPAPDGADESRSRRGQRRGLRDRAVNGARNLFSRVWRSLESPDLPALSLLGPLLLMLGTYLALFLFAGIIWLALMVHPIFLLLIPIFIIAFAIWRFLRPPQGMHRLWREIPPRFLRWIVTPQGGLGLLLFILVILLTAVAPLVAFWTMLGTLVVCWLASWWLASFIGVRQPPLEQRSLLLQVIVWLWRSVWATAVIILGAAFQMMVQSGYDRAIENGTQADLALRDALINGGTLTLRIAFIVAFALSSLTIWAGLIRARKIGRQAAIERSLSWLGSRITIGNTKVRKLLRAWLAQLLYVLTTPAFSLTMTILGASIVGTATAYWV